MHHFGASGNVSANAIVQEWIIDNVTRWFGTTMHKKHKTPEDKRMTCGLHKGCTNHVMNFFFKSDQLMSFFLNRSDTLSIPLTSMIAEPKTHSIRRAKTEVKFLVEIPVERSDVSNIEIALLCFVVSQWRHLCWIWFLMTPNTHSIQRGEHFSFVGFDVCSADFVFQINFFDWLIDWGF